MKMTTKRGFTLIELMIVVAIIGILAAIAIPKFSQLITKGNEANTKGNLGAIRSALSIYYGDTEGWYPTNDVATTLVANNKYLATIPPAKVPPVNGSPGHPDSNIITNTTGINDALGGWAYNNVQSNDWGRVLVNCSHMDSRGQAWSSY